VHRMLARYADLAVVAVRHFYATRHYDALSLTVGALRAGEEETELTATWRFAAERLARLRDVVQHPWARRRVREALLEHVTAIRAAVQTDGVPTPVRPL
jgi:hypothetical protein